MSFFFLDYTWFQSMLYVLLWYQFSLLLLNRITHNQCFTKSLVYFLMKITLDQIQKILHYIKFRNIFLIHRVHRLHYWINFRNHTSRSTSEFNLPRDFPNSNPVYQVQKYILQYIYLRKCSSASTFHKPHQYIQLGNKSDEIFRIQY